MKKSLSFYISNAILFLIGCVLFFTPIILNTKLISYFIIEKTFFFLLLVEIIVLLYLFLILFFKEFWPKKNYIIYSFLLFVLINILSAIWGKYPLFSFWSSFERADGVILLIHVFLFFLVIVSIVRSKKVLNLLLWVSTISATLSAVFIFLSLAGIGIIRFFGLGAGLLGNDSYAVGYLLFNLFFILYLLFETQNKSVRYILETMFILIIFSPTLFNFSIFEGLVSFSDILNNPIVILGTARAGTIGLILGLICFIILFFINHKNKLIRFGAKISIGIFFITIITFFISTLILNSNQNKWFKDKTNGGYRFIYWDQAIEGFKERPILGWGHGTFEFVNIKYFNPVVLSMNNGVEVWVDKPHNKILEVLFSNGVVGLLSYLSIFIFSLFILWKSQKISQQAKAIFSGLFLAYFLQNLVFFDSLLTYIMFIFFLSMIVILDDGFKDYEKNQKSIIKNTNKNIFLLVLLLVLIGGCSVMYFVIAPFKKTGNYSKFFLYTPEIRASMYEKNFKISPFGGSNNEMLFGNIFYKKYSNKINEIKKEEDISRYINDIDSIISNIEKSFGGQGKTYRGVSVILQLYKLRNSLIKTDPVILKKIKGYGLEAINMSPNDPRSYFMYSEPFLYEGNYKKVLNILGKAIVLNPNISELHKTIINIAKLTGDNEIIEQKIKQAKFYIPDVDFK